MYNLLARVSRQSSVFPRRINTFNGYMASVPVANHNTLSFKSKSQNQEIIKAAQVGSVRSCATGDHVKLWTAERALSAALLGVIPAAVLMPTPAMETLMALSLTLHSHWGVEAIVHDYIRPSVFGNVIPKLSVVFVQFLSIMTFGSLCFFIYSDVGLINAVGMLWQL